MKSIEELEELYNKLQIRVSEFRNGERDTVFLIYNDKTGHWIWIDADETRPVE